VRVRLLACACAPLFEMFYLFECSFVCLCVFLLVILCMCVAVHVGFSHSLGRRTARVNSMQTVRWMLCVGFLVKLQSIIPRTTPNNPVPRLAILTVFIHLLLLFCCLYHQTYSDC
jgi:hypothetical protein